MTPAQESLVLDNRGLVWRQAKVYWRVSVLRRAAGDFDDMVAAGFLGLVRAAIKFDPERGVKFCTYAVWAIKSAMLDLRRKGAIGVPVNALHEQARAHAGETLDARATERVVSAVAALKPRQFADDDDWNTHDWLRDRHDDMPRVLDRDEVAALLPDLDARGRTVIVHHYGLLGCPPRSLAEISGDLGVTRQRVAMLHQEALLRLRAGVRRRGLTHAD